MKPAPYYERVFRQLDILVNVVALGREYETVSARAGRALEKPNRPFACLLCAFLDIFEKDHCAKSLERTRGRLTHEACR